MGFSSAATLVALSIKTAQGVGKMPHEALRALAVDLGFGIGGMGVWAILLFLGASRKFSQHIEQIISMY
jgi:hypothetical protein